MKTPIKLNKKRHLVLNTCPLDLICSIIAMAYTDSENYKKFININTNKTLQFYRDLAINGRSSYIYKKRLEILKTIFSEDQGITDIVVINAQCNVLYIINMLLKSSPSATEIKPCSSEKCGVKEWNSPTITTKLTCGLINIQDDINQNVKAKQQNVKAVDVLLLRKKTT